MECYPAPVIVYYSESGEDKEASLNNPSQEHLVNVLARRLVPQIAPYEMKLFQQQREAYLQNPEQVLQNQIGENLGESMIFLTPIVLAVLNDVICFILREMKQTIDCENNILLDTAVKQAFTKIIIDEQGIGEHNLTLTSKQCQQIHQLALDKARQYKLSNHKSKLLADTVVQSLSTSN